MLHVVLCDNKKNHKYMVLKYYTKMSQASAALGLISTKRFLVVKMHNKAHLFERKKPVFVFVLYIY